MTYKLFQFRLPEPSLTDPANDAGARNMVIVALPNSAVIRTEDAAVALHLFEEARSGNIPPGLPDGIVWGRGLVPRLLAAAFVDALMGAGRLLERFGKLTGEDNVISAAANYFAAFPDLRDLRDSIEHEDERMQFRARNKEIPAPIITLGPGESVALDETMMFYAPSLAGTTFQATAQDGRLAKLDVSHATLDRARLSTQAVFDATGRTANGHDWPPNTG